MEYCGHVTIICYSDNWEDIKDEIKRSNILQVAPSSLHVYLYLRICVFVYLYLCFCICVFVNLYLCICICVFVFVYARSYKQRQCVVWRHSPYTSNQPT